MTRRRVVVTGLGIISPIGNAVPEAWDNALAGKPGITRITRFDPARLASQIAGEVKGFDVAPYMSPKEARRMDLFIHYGMAAGLQAWRDGGLQVTPENAERVGINFGSGIGVAGAQGLVQRDDIETLIIRLEIQPSRPGGSKHTTGGPQTYPRRVHVDDLARDDARLPYDHGSLERLYGFRGPLSDR